MSRRPAKCAEPAEAVRFSGAVTPAEEGAREHNVFRVNQSQTPSDGFSVGRSGGVGGGVMLKIISVWRNVLGDDVRPSADMPLSNVQAHAAHNTPLTTYDCNIFEQKCLRDSARSANRRTARRSPIADPDSESGRFCPDIWAD